MIFAMTAIPYVLLTSQVFGKSVEEATFDGFFFGLFFGLVTAPMMMTITRTIPCANQDAFIRKLNVAMATVGFNPKSRTGDLILFESPGASLKLGPMSLTPASFFTISVQLEPSSATLVGPRYFTRKLEKRLVV